METAFKGNPITDAVLDALGLDGDNVLSITIKLEACQPITATVEIYIPTGLGAALGSATWTLQ